MSNEVELHVERRGDKLLVFDQDGRPVRGLQRVEVRCAVDELNTLRLDVYEFGGRHQQNRPKPPPSPDDYEITGAPINWRKLAGWLKR